MNKNITARKVHPRRENVIIRSPKGETRYRRIWGGIAWPIVPNPGAVCIVGEREPDKENVTLNTLYLLSYGSAITTDELLRACIDRKDHWCVSRFFVNAANEAFLRQFRKADGLTHFVPKGDYKGRFPYFKDPEHVARILPAPQADNPDYGLQLVRDYIEGSEPRLLITEEVDEKLRTENVLPVAKERLTSGMHPAIEALRYVLAAFVTKPVYSGSRGGSGGITNWKAKRRKPEGSGYREWYIY